MKQNLRHRLAQRLLIAPAVALLVLGGCTANVVDYPVQDFANLRIMNFAPLPAVSMDVYFWQSGQSHPTYAQSQNLGYGGGAVYTTGIPAATGGTVYDYDVTPATHPEKHNIPGTPTMTLFPGKKYTLMITLVNGNFVSQLIEDDIQPAGVDTTKHPAYVRFINMQSGTPKLSVRVNDVNSGELIDMVSGAHGVDFNHTSDYHALYTATDTSYAFFVMQTGGGDALPLARLTDQTFTANNYYTLIYAGDPARMTIDTSTTDTAQAPLDNYRLRAFDDNGIGNDQTAPIQPAFRYNLVNGLVPYGVLANNGTGYYNGYSKLGFTVNGDNLREHNNFTIWPVPALTPAGSGFSQNADGTWNVHFSSTSIPIHKIEVAATATDDAGKNIHLLFDLNDNNKNGYDETKIHSDTAISFIFVQADSTYKAPPGIWGVGIPNYSYPDSIILVFVSDVQLPIGSGRYSNFTTTVGGTTMQFKSRPPGNSNTLVIPASGAVTVGVVDSVGLGNKAILGDTTSFSAQPGGVYEIVSVGTQVTNKILVMHVNGQP